MVVTMHDKGTDPGRRYHIGLLCLFPRQATLDEVPFLVQIVVIVVSLLISPLVSPALRQTGRSEEGEPC